MWSHSLDNYFVFSVQETEQQSLSVCITRGAPCEQQVTDVVYINIVYVNLSLHILSLTSTENGD